MHNVQPSVPAGTLCSPSQHQVCSHTERIHKNSLLGAVFAAANNAVFQPQRESPDDPRANIELIHSLATLQNPGDSSKALRPSRRFCFFFFPSPFFSPSVVFGTIKNTIKHLQTDALEQFFQFFVRIVCIELVNEAIGAPNLADHFANTRDALDQPQMLNGEECASFHLVRHPALLALQLYGHYPPLQLTTPQCRRWRGKVAALSVVCNIQRGCSCCIILRIQDLDAVNSTTYELKHEEGNPPRRYSQRWTEALLHRTACAEIREESYRSPPTPSSACQPQEID